MEALNYMLNIIPAVEYIFSLVPVLVLGVFPIRNRKLVALPRSSAWK